MTREEAIGHLRTIIIYSENDGYTDVAREALKMAIKSLEQESVLDKIRADIESQRREVSNKNFENKELQAFYFGLNDGLKDARDIIDEYIEEIREGAEE